MHNFVIEICTQVHNSVMNSALWDMELLHGGIVKDVNTCVWIPKLMNASNNDVQLCTWWRHQMETFSALLAICAGNSPATGEFPAQRPVTRSFDVFFDLRLNNGCVNNREAGDLRHHCAHCDVIVMNLADNIKKSTPPRMKSWMKKQFYRKSLYHANTMWFDRIWSLPPLRTGCLFY